MKEKSMVNSLRAMLEEAKHDSHTNLLNKEKAIAVAKDLFGAGQVPDPIPTEEKSK